MKFKYIIALLGLSFLINCSPKVTQEVNKKEEMVKEVMEVETETWRSSVPKPGAARAVDMGEFNVFTLDNGLNVIVVENHKLPRVSYSLSLKNDQINEKNKAGMVSFTGQMLQSGTKNRDKAQLDKDKDFIGANVSAFGSGMFGSSLTKHQDKLLDIMTDMLYNPAWPKAEFDKILKQNLSGIESSKTDPNSMAANVAAVVNYGKNHPYGEIETAETYNSISLQDCKKYYNTFFKPNNAYLTIVGDITPAQAKKEVDKYFSKWKTGDIPAISHKKPKRPNGTQVEIANKDGAVQSVIRITYPVDYEIGDPDAAAVTVMNSILGGGIFSGRLMQNLREDKAYTYGARSNISSNKLIGNFNASASVRTEVTDSSVVEFLYEMNRMSTEPVDPEDLQLSKNSLAGGFARSLESPQTLARFARNIEEFNLPQDYYETYLKRLDAVTVADVQRVAAKFVTPNNANIVVVGNKDEIADKLMRFDSDGVIDYYDAFGNKMEANATPLPDGITGAVVVNDYLKAIGGEAKLKAVKSLEYHYATEMMGQAINIDMYQMAPNKFAMKVGNDQMTFQESKFNGTKASTSAMGQSEVATEGPAFEAAKEQAIMFSQLNYGSGYDLKVKGIENVDGEPCYKVAVKKGDNTTTEFYSVKTNLLKRSVQTQEGMPGQVMTITSDYGDYKAVNGIMLPYTVTTTGMGPAPMAMKASSIKVNEAIDASLFEIK
ncbi:insulinase family protein [Saprospiraceae bacterium]|nr:insulinase family protein [Saprospiraceae bacterium]